MDFNNKCTKERRNYIDEDLHYIKSKLNEGHCLVIHTYCSSFVTGTLSNAETQEITGAYLIAADANFDGDVNNLDSSTILNYDAEIIDISQNLGTTVAPDWVYYQYEVEF